MDAFVHLAGNVGSEVEVRGQSAVASFRLGSTPRLRVGDGWTDGHTTWLTVTCFRALAEHVAASLRKGDPVIVVGRLRTSVWQRDGQTYERLGIEAVTVGHDLSRGMTRFVRRERTVPEEERPTAPDEAGPPPAETPAEARAEDGLAVVGGAAYAA